VGGRKLVLTFFFKFLRLVSTLVLSRFPGLVRPALLAPLLVKRRRRGIVREGG